MGCPYYKVRITKEGDIDELCRRKWNEKSLDYGACYCWGDELACDLEPEEEEEPSL